MWRLDIVNTGRFSPRIPIKSIENGYAWNRLHRLSGRFFNENTPNHKTKSMNIFLDVLMIDHPTDISKDCHQTTQIFAQAAVVMNLTGQIGRHFSGSRSPCWQRCEWSVGVFTWCLIIKFWQNDNIKFYISFLWYKNQTSKIYFRVRKIVLKFLNRHSFRMEQNYFLKLVPKWSSSIGQHHKSNHGNELCIA